MRPARAAQLLPVSNRLGERPQRARRAPNRLRCRVTDDDLRTALCYHRTYARILRPAMSVLFDAPPRSASRLNRAVDSFDHEIQRLWEGHILTA